MVSNSLVYVTVLPAGRQITAESGAFLIEILARAGFNLRTPCGGNGTCGKCRVRIVKGKCAVSALDKETLSPEQLNGGLRLACQAKAAENLTIEIPPETQSLALHKVLVSGVWGGSGDTLSLVRAAITSIHNGHYGAAFDIGTTTIAAVLMELSTGNEVAVYSCMNPQIIHGDDVISRIQFACSGTTSARQLQSLLLDVVRDALHTMASQAGVGVHKIHKIVFAGNSTMQQSLLGLDLSALGKVPFTPAFRKGYMLAASDLQLPSGPGAQAYVFGQIGGFVGGDTIAGMVACQLDKWPRPVLLVDIGTNGEIALAHNNRILATSAAAGPAFEGARIHHGMRAVQGAIEKVQIHSNVELGVIGDAPPLGICGSGLVDAVAEMLRSGIMDMTGRILTSEEVADSVPHSLRKRLKNSSQGVDFILAEPGESGNREGVFITQKDIRQVQLAMGAIRAGIHILLKKAGVTLEEVDKIFLAGAFANFIRPVNAIRMGLFPAADLEKIHFMGNSAFLGAVRVLLSETEQAYGESLRQKSEHVDLSLDPEFQMEFGMAMMFPEQGV